MGSNIETHQENNSSNFIFSDHSNCIQKVNIKSIASLSTGPQNYPFTFWHFGETLAVLNNPKFSLLNYNRALFRARGILFQPIRKKGHWWGANQLAGIAPYAKGLGLNAGFGPEMENLLHVIFQLWLIHSGHLERQEQCRGLINTPL